MTKAEFIQLVVARVNDVERAAAAIAHAEQLWAILEGRGYGANRTQLPQIAGGGFAFHKVETVPVNQPVQMGPATPSIDVVRSNLIGEMKALQNLAKHAKPGQFDADIAALEAKINALGVTNEQHSAT